MFPKKVALVSRQDKDLRQFAFENKLLVLYLSPTGTANQLSRFQFEEVHIGKSVRELLETEAEKYNKDNQLQKAIAACVADYRAKTGKSVADCVKYW